MVSATSLRRFWQWLFRDWGPSSGVKTSYEAIATIVSPYSPKPVTGQPILPVTIQSRSVSITECTDEKIITPDDSSHYLCLEAFHDFICTSFFSGQMTGRATRTGRYGRLSCSVVPAWPTAGHLPEAPGETAQNSRHTAPGGQR